MDGSDGSGDSLPPGQHPVRLVMEYPERFSRAQAFFFGIFPVGIFALIPHFFMLWLYGIAMGVINFIAFWAILITGRYPQGMWEFARKYVQFMMRIQAYMSVLAPQYPPMSPNGEYRWLEVVVPYPEHSSRLWLFLAGIAVFPVAIVNGIMGIGAAFLRMIAVWIVLFTGRFPQGWWEFCRKVTQQRLRMMFFIYWLRSEYPPFGLDD